MDSPPSSPPRAYQLHLRNAPATSLDKHVAQFVYRFGRPVLTAENLAEADAARTSTVPGKDGWNWEREDEHYHKYMLVRELEQRIEACVGDRLHADLESAPERDPTKEKALYDQVLHDVKRARKYHDLKETLVNEVRDSVHRLGSGQFGPVQHLASGAESRFSFQSTPSPTGSDARSEFSTLSLGRLPLPDEIIPLANTLSSSGDPSRRAHALETLLAYASGDLVSSSAWPKLKAALLAALSDDDLDIADRVLVAHGDLFEASAPVQTADIYLNIIDHIHTEWDSAPVMMNGSSLDLGKPRIAFFLQRFRLLHDLMLLIPQFWGAYANETYTRVFTSTAALLGADVGAENSIPSRMAPGDRGSVLLSPMGFLALIDPTGDWLSLWVKQGNSRAQFYKALNDARVISHAIHTLKQSPLCGKARRSQDDVAREIVDLQTSTPLAKRHTMSMLPIDDISHFYTLVSIAILGHVLSFHEGRVLLVGDSGGKRSSRGGSSFIDDCVSMLVSCVVNSGRDVRRSGVRVCGIAALSLQSIIKYSGRHVVFKEQHAHDLLAPIVAYIDKSNFTTDPAHGAMLGIKPASLRIGGISGLKDSEMSIWQVAFHLFEQILIHSPGTAQVAVSDSTLELLASCLLDILTPRSKAGSEFGQDSASAIAFPMEIITTALALVRRLLLHPVWQARLYPFGFHYVLAELSNELGKGPGYDATNSAMSAFLSTVRGAELVASVKKLDAAVGQIARDTVPQSGRSSQLTRKQALVMIGNASIAVRDGLVRVVRAATPLITAILSEFWELAHDPELLDRLDTPGPVPAVVSEMRALFLCPGGLPLFLTSAACEHTLWPVLHCLAFGGVIKDDSQSRPGFAMPAPVDAIQLGLRVLASVITSRDAEFQLSSRCSLSDSLSSLLPVHVRARDQPERPSPSPTSSVKSPTPDSTTTPSERDQNAGGGVDDEPIVIVDMNTVLAYRLVSRMNRPATGLDGSLQRQASSGQDIDIPRSLAPPLPPHISTWVEPAEPVSVNPNADHDTNQGVSAQGGVPARVARIISSMTPYDDDDPVDALDGYRQQLMELAGSRLPPNSCHDIAMTLTSVLPHCAKVPEMDRLAPFPPLPTRSAKAPRWFGRLPEVRRAAVQLSAGLAASAGVVPDMDRDLFIEDMNSFLSGVEQLLKVSSRAEKMEIATFGSTDVPSIPFELRLPGSAKVLTDDCLELTFGFDYFAATMYLIMKDDAMLLLSSLCDHAISIFLWPYRWIEYTPRRDILHATRPQCALANLVDLILALEYPTIWTCLTSQGLSPAKVTLSWLTHCFWDTLPLDQITLYIAYCLASGIDFPVYFTVALFAHLEDTLVIHNNTSVDAIALTLEQPVSGFDVRSAMMLMNKLAKRHRPMCLSELKRILPGATAGGEDQRRMSIGREEV